jgi:hypothetical protein
VGRPIYSFGDRSYWRGGPSVAPGAQGHMDNSAIASVGHMHNSAIAWVAHIRKHEWTARLEEMRLDKAVAARLGHSLVHMSALPRLAHQAGRPQIGNRLEIY